jgi:hypothetical protein
MSGGGLLKRQSRHPISHVSRCLWWPFLAFLFPFARSARHFMPSDPTSFISAAPAEDRPIIAVELFFSQLLHLAACGVACGKISHLSLDQCPAQSPRLPPSKVTAFPSPTSESFPTLNSSKDHPHSLCIQARLTHTIFPILRSIPTLR